jgi:hypothetical protein
MSVSVDDFRQVPIIPVDEIRLEPHRKISIRLRSGRWLYYQVGQTEGLPYEAVEGISVDEHFRARVSFRSEALDAVTFLVCLEEEESICSFQLVKDDRRFQ